MDLVTGFLFHTHIRPGLCCKHPQRRGQLRRVRREDFRVLSDCRDGEAYMPFRSRILGPLLDWADIKMQDLKCL
jgi:hypothetical protein